MILVMALINLNIPKPKPFRYQPRYYDERRDHLEKMQARARAEIAVENGDMQHSGLQKGFLSESRKNAKHKRNELKDASNMRVLRYLIIIIILLGIFYIFSPELFLAFWSAKWLTDYQ